MENKYYIKTIRPAGFISILSLSLGIILFFLSFIIILSLIMNIILNSYDNLLSSIIVSMIGLITGFLFIFVIISQKIIISNNCVKIYLFGKNKWKIDLTVLNKADLGWYYKELFKDRKIISIKVTTGKNNFCFPVDAYSTKQIRTILFIINNSSNVKINDSRLKGQEKYLINAHFVKALYPKENNKHNQCEFCKKFFGETNQLFKGYTTKERNYWICENCFEDFKELLLFKIIKNSKSDAIKE